MPRQQRGSAIEKSSDDQNRYSSCRGQASHDIRKIFKAKNKMGRRMWNDLDNKRGMESEGKKLL